MESRLGFATLELKPNYRRSLTPGGTYFFTVVTERRVPLFDDGHARALLGSMMRRCLWRYPHERLAIVLLPDHLHALWTLSSGDDGYAARWQWIKQEFTRHWLACGGEEQRRSPSRQRQRRRGVWQRRYWEHTIHDEADLEAHFDYIHYNPVKHGYVERPRDCPSSSFHRWVQRGHYPLEWAAGARHDLPGSAGE